MNSCLPPSLPLSRINLQIIDLNILVEILGIPSLNQAQDLLDCQRKLSASMRDQGLYAKALQLH